MAASDVVGVVAAVSAADTGLLSSSIDLMLFVNICRKGCFKKLKYSVFLLVRALSLSKGDRCCQNLAMAKILKRLQFPVKPSVRKTNF